MPVQLPPIDDDVYAALQGRAIPLEDDVNSVLRRLLGLSKRAQEPVVEPRPTPPDAPAPSRPRRAGGAGKAALKRTRVSKGSILPEPEYEIPILRALDQLGGRVPTSEVIGHLEKQLDARLTAADREKLSSGDIRWRNRAQFVRLKLIEKGEMVASSPRGIWEISAAGRERLAKEG